MTERPPHMTERPPHMTERPAHITERPAHMTERPAHMAEHHAHKKKSKKDRRKTTRRHRTAMQTLRTVEEEDDGTQVEDGTPIKGRRRGSAQTRRPSTMDTHQAKEQLRRFALNTEAKGMSGILQEFMNLKKTTSKPGAKTAFDANEKKNRYRDATRVVLKGPPGTSDYIHANYVEFKGVTKFICTQAPIDNTIDDFWRMIIYERCQAIVMLCELVEQNKCKCAVYYPVELNQTIRTTTGISIKNLSVMPMENIITKSRLEVTYNGRKFDVTHFKWNNWPDRGVPDSKMAPFRLFTRLSSFERVVMHCSAGIGRTGTIVGLYMAMEVLKAGEPLLMTEVVRELRLRRHGSVQTDIQYAYMHRVLLDLAENKGLVKSKEIHKFITDYDAYYK